jgi:esterase/lipase
MKKKDKIAINIFILFYLIFGFYLVTNQEKIIYLPSGEQDFKSCTSFLKAQKVDYKGTRMYVRSGTDATVVLYHGNAGSACDRYFYVENFIPEKYGYIVVEYAGYSNDDKIVTHDLIKKDVENVISYINNKEIKNIIVVGESIGTGPASYHAFLEKPKKILLISPFASLKDVAGRKFWFYPVSFLVDNAFDNIKFLSKYSGPVLIVHGDKDKIISQKSGLRLYKSLVSKEKKFVSIKGFGHNDLFNASTTFKVVYSFLNE